MEQAATDPDACPLGKPILAVPRDGMGRSVSGAVEPSCRSGRSCVDVLAPQMSVARRALQFRMVRDPSIVSPSLTGVFIGGGHNKTRYRIEVHAAEAVSSPLSPTAMAV